MGRRIERVGLIGIAVITVAGAIRLVHRPSWPAAGPRTDTRETSSGRSLVGC